MSDATSHSLEARSRVNLKSVSENFEQNFERFTQSSFWRQLNLKLVDWLITLQSSACQLSRELSKRLKSIVLFFIRNKIDIINVIFIKTKLKGCMMILFLSYDLPPETWFKFSNLVSKQI
jgi:hypothetical protein